MFQVHVDMNGKAVSAEALARWNQPQRSWVSPAQFILLADESDLILLIGNRELLQGCMLPARRAKQAATS
jgi:sensor c-di-GMP phosphodiesterase-like protein